MVTAVAMRAAADMELGRFSSARERLVEAKALLEGTTTTTQGFHLLAQTIALHLEGRDAEEEVQDGMDAWLEQHPGPYPGSMHRILLETASHSLRMRSQRCKASDEEQ